MPLTSMVGSLSADLVGTVSPIPAVPTLFAPPTGGRSGADGGGGLVAPVTVSLTLKVGTGSVGLLGTAPPDPAVPVVFVPPPTGGGVGGGGGGGTVFSLSPGIGGGDGLNHDPLLGGPVGAAGIGARGGVAAPPDFPGSITGGKSGSDGVGSFCTAGGGGGGRVSPPEVPLFGLGLTSPALASAAIVIGSPSRSVAGLAVSLMSFMGGNCVGSTYFGPAGSAGSVPGRGTGPATTFLSTPSFTGGCFTLSVEPPLWGFQGPSQPPGFPPTTGWLLPAATGTLAGGEGFAGGGGGGAESPPGRGIPISSSGPVGLDFGSSLLPLLSLGKCAGGVVSAPEPPGPLDAAGASGVAPPVKRIAPLATASESAGGSFPSSGPGCWSVWAAT